MCNPDLVPTQTRSGCGEHCSEHLRHHSQDTWNYSPLRRSLIEWCHFTEMTFAVIPIKEGSQR